VFNKPQNKKKYKHTVAIHIQSTVACHQVSQQEITAQALLGLLAKRSLLFFGSQCLRAKHRHYT